MRWLIALLKHTFADWSAHKAPKMGAALAYYTVFSLAPMLMIILSIASIVFDEKYAREQILQQFGSLIGQHGAESIEAILAANARQPGTSIFAAISGFAVLLFGASGVFAELQDSLNTIWEVKPRTSGGIWTIIKERFLSFVMVLGTGFLLLTSLVLTAAIAALSKYFTSYFAGAGVVFEAVNFILSFAVITVLFAMIYRILPDVRIDWSDVWVGAVVTALLFDIGKFLLGLYLGRSAVASSYGAAGSVVVLLLWVFYSAQILFFGAELTRAYATSCGSHCKIPPTQA
jgi:membrane protein